MVVPMWALETGILHRMFSAMNKSTEIIDYGYSATAGGAEDDGRGSNGGVWEWTTTVFDGHEGLVPTDHFTGYSTDFFDGKHQIVVRLNLFRVIRFDG